MASPIRVAVTGAAGRTGVILSRKLLEGGSKYEHVFFVRTDAKRDYLKKTLGDKANVQVLDVTSPNAHSALKSALQGFDALVILTSATPSLLISSLPGVVLSKLFSSTPRKPQFYYAPGGEPEQVDWVGQKSQIDAAKEAGVKQVILISSMAGTEPDHFLNSMGNGKIILWKRKAEQYLIASGLQYTIIHPGGLLPHFGKFNAVPGGQRELLLGVNDEYLNSTTKLVPREDLAQLIVDCLLEPQSFNTSFDLVSREPGEGTPYSGDAKSLLATLNNRHTDYSTPDVDALLQPQA